MDSADSSQIRRLLALYCQLMDDRRYDEWSQLFAPDGIWALGGREYRGPAEAKQYMDELLRKRPQRRTRHLCTNVLIEPEGEASRVSSDYAMLAREPDLAPWTVVAFGRYLDRVARRTDGDAWQFVERRLVTA